MGDERLEKLGIRRRRFLKSTAAAAFVSPLVVSFGLDGSAEASVIPVQYCPNMTSQNFTSYMLNIVYFDLLGVEAGEIDGAAGAAIAQSAYLMAISVAGIGPPARLNNLSRQLNQLQAKVDSLPSNQYKSGLQSWVDDAQAALECVP